MGFLLNYNAVLAKKDGSCIPIRHDFDTHGAFVRNYKQDYDDALDTGNYQIVVGDLVVDVEDISHIQPVYEEEVGEATEEQGGTKGMQLYGEGFMAEGDPYELAVFAKNLQADEICMSDCCEDEEDCCDECDCDVDEEACSISSSPFTWSINLGESKDFAVVVLQIPYGDNFEERSSNLVKHVQKQYGDDVKVIVLPDDVQIIDSNL